jgi:hypothetical protein
LATETADADASADTAADAAKSDGGSDGRKSYDEGYVKSLRDESRKRIERAQAAEKERDELRAKIDAAERNDLEKKGELAKLLDKERKDRERSEAEYSEKLSARDRRIILAEAKAIAVREGIIDISDVASGLDIKDLRIDEDGEVAGLAEQIAALKAKKPHWFKASGVGDAALDTKADDKAAADRKRLTTPPARSDSGTKNSLDHSKSTEAEFQATMKKYGVTA